MIWGYERWIGNEIHKTKLIFTFAIRMLNIHTPRYIERGLFLDIFNKGHPLIEFKSWKTNNQLNIIVILKLQLFNW